MDLMSIRRGLLMMLVEGGTSDMELIKTFTVQESWENDSKGNPVAIFSAVMSDITDMKLQDIYVLVMKNNNASNYKCDAIVASSNDTGSARNGYCIRGGWTQPRAFAASSSAWCSQGTTIEVYKTSFPS